VLKSTVSDILYYYKTKHKIENKPHLG